jgi:hypothetical protein
LVKATLVYLHELVEVEVSKQKALAIVKVTKRKGSDWDERRPLGTSKAH